MITVITPHQCNQPTLTIYWENKSIFYSDRDVIVYNSSLRGPFISNNSFEWTIQKAAHTIFYPPSNILSWESIYPAIRMCRSKCECHPSITCQTDDLTRECSFVSTAFEIPGSAETRWATRKTWTSVHLLYQMYVYCNVIVVKCVHDSTECHKWLRAMPH